MEGVIAIYSTAIKSVLCHEKTREIKFREFSSDIKGLLAVEYVVLSYETEVQHESDEKKCYDENLLFLTLAFDNVK